MNEPDFLTHNLTALRRNDPHLASRLAAMRSARRPERYDFLQSRSGHTVPAWRDEGGTARPLHSLVDPLREAARLIGQTKDEGFFVFLGLGGGFAIAEALARPTAEQVLVIDYDLVAVAELLAAIDYTTILGDTRCVLLVDEPASLVEQTILERYQPALANGIRALPLRTRIAASGSALFDTALAAIQRAIELVSDDYSVQAFFGTRWFSNSIRNLACFIDQAADQPSFPSVKHVSICGAGPSLDMQFTRLAEKRRDTFLMAT
ncbi:MAG: hypothetical protein LBS86_05000, partial [Treponema sp.]|nr:hypothetical protein [Treponema sp.]